MRNLITSLLIFCSLATAQTASYKNVKEFRLLPKATGSRPTGAEGQFFCDATTHRCQLKDNISWYNLSGPATQDIWTNKTFDADATGNSISNIENADIKAGAAIARSKLGTGTADHVVINDGSGNFSSEAALSAARGGTGVANNSAATLTRSGNHALTFTTTGTTSLTLPTSGTVATTADISAAGNFAYADLRNCGFETSVSGNALTFTLTTADGSTPSAGSPCYIGFSTSEVSGGFVTRSVTGALSITISSGSTLGFKNSNAKYIYLYAIDDGGTVVLGVSGAIWEEATEEGFTVEGGAGGADDGTQIYVTADPGIEPFRLIGRAEISEATPGTWSSDAYELSMWPFELQPAIAIYTTNTAQSFTSGATTVIDFEDRTRDTDQAVTTGAGWNFNCPRSGYYQVSAQATLAGNTGLAAGEPVDITVYVAGSSQGTLAFSSYWAANNVQVMMSGSTIVACSRDQDIDIRLTQTSGGAIALDGATAHNKVTIAFVGKINSP